MVLIKCIGTGIKCSLLKMPLSPLIVFLSHWWFTGGQNIPVILVAGILIQPFSLERMYYPIIPLM